MGLEFPDWLRGAALVGQNGVNYLPVAVDPAGQMYIVLTGAPDITIPGDVNIVDLNTLKQIQGTDGTVFRTAKVDANGQFIMVPRGQTGNYMSVDASGYLTAILKGLKPDASLGSIAVDASGQLIMVPRGATGNYMNVDAAGYLTAILKGLEGANLRTIAVDDTGRMIGLIANVNAAWGYTQNESLANLAASMRPIQRWDKRGQIIEVTDFENGFPPQISLYHPGSESYAIEPHYSQSGDYCLDVLTQAAVDSYIEFWQDFRMVPSSKFGVEIALALGSSQLEIILAADLFTGAERYQSRVAWTAHNSTLYYQNSAGALVSLSSNAKLMLSTGIYNHIKLVADFTTYKYMRVLLNEQSFAIPTQELYHSADTSAPHLKFYLRILSKYAVAYHVYVDDWIVTAEEPL